MASKPKKARKPTKPRKPRKTKHDNEQIFLRAATTDEGFRQALHSGDKQQIRKALRRVGIKVADIKAVVDEIVNVDWNELYTLERRLTGAEVQPDN